MNLEQKQSLMRERKLGANCARRMALTADDFDERHYTVEEIATVWKISTDTVRRLFADEPGVLVIGADESKPGGDGTRLFASRNLSSLGYTNDIAKSEVHMPTIYRKQVMNCKHRSQGRKYRPCKCHRRVDDFLGEDSATATLEDQA